MENLKKIVLNAYNNNEEEFLREIRTAINENEYKPNERTEIVVRGCFDSDTCYPYIQFVLKTDQYNYHSEFYRSDFCRKSKPITLDDYLVEDEIVDVLKLYKDDLGYEA